MPPSVHRRTRFAVAGALVTLISVLLPDAAGAKTLFRNPAWEVGDDPAGLAAGDLNDDGLLDLAATIPYDREVSILYGNGDLTFRAGGRWPVGFNPGSVAIADLDGDGLGDLIVANRDSDDLTALLNAPGETFQPLGPFPAGGSPREIAVGDFDNDGRPDVAVASGGGVSVLIGRGDGTFGAETRFLSGTDVRSIAAGDFDPDGALDLVLTVRSFQPTGALVVTLMVLDGQGNGTFTQGFSATADPGCGDDRIAVADVDGDGIDDVVVSGEQVAVLRSNGRGSFRPKRCYDGAPGPILTGQFDAGAPIDVAIYGLAPTFGTQGITMLPGSGNGNFGARVISLLPFQEFPRYVPSVALADFDGDGRPDLAAAVAGRVGVEDTRTVWMLPGNGDGTFGPFTVIESDCMIPSVDWADLDGDGFDDLAALLTPRTSCPSHRVAVHLSNGDGTFGPALHSGTQPAGATFDRLLAIGEIDGDGRPDVVVSTDSSQVELTVLFGNGDGTFVESAPFPFGIAGGPRWRSGAIGDFDEDGSGDVVAALSTPSLSLLLNDGAGGWMPERTIGLPGTPRQVVSGDFNADGHRDLAVWTFADPPILILPGRGDGTFIPLSGIEVDLEGPIAVGDLDGAGGDDIATGSPLVLLGQPDGTFVTRPRPGPVAERLAIGDLTGDGRADLIVGRVPEEPGLIVLPGLGGGAFGDGLSFSGEYRTLHAGRFDALGGRDLAGLSAWRRIFVLDNGAPVDLDDDGVRDAIDNCPVSPNPGQENADGDPFGDACDICPFDPNPGREDTDGDGLGDPCDPCTDTDGDGFGDPGFPANVCAADGCPADPHPVGDGCRPDELTVLSIRVRDLNGDLDPFADPGEIVRMSLRIRNDGPRDLSGVGLMLASADPDVACITKTTIDLGGLPAGSESDTAALGEPAGSFEFTVSGGVTTVDPRAPASAEFTLGLTSHETGGREIAQPIRITLDLDLPPGADPLPVAGPDGIDGTADDGTILENFDIDKDGDGVFTVDDTFLQAEELGGGLRYSGAPGAYLRGADATGLANRMAAIACFGFDTIDDGNLACRLDPDFPIDWHFHCPPGAADCPNDEILPGDSAPRTCVGGCFYDTPANGAHALSPPNSLHMGAHFDLTDAARGDTTHFRTLQAFMSPPINLTPFPADDLEMSFFHIIDLMDNNNVGLSPGFCADCADVQIQVDVDPDPLVDQWGFWEKLVPFQNGYDHTPDSGTFGGYYCLLTPADTGTDAPSPRGIRETICAPQGAWSNCGSDIGTSVTAVGDCDGPGFLDPSGTGVWVQSRFDLRGFAGDRIRIRWIGASWNFAGPASSYFEYGAGWDSVGQDDGWWLDDIRIAPAVREQSSRVTDADPPAGGVCPAANCDPSIGDNGTDVVLSVTDLAGNPIDGIDVVAVAGQVVRVSVFGSTLPGGCVGGVPEYRLFRDVVLLRDWSQDPSVEETPPGDALYSALARCSSDPACTSATGATAGVFVYRDDGAGIDLTVLHDPVAPDTAISWTSRPQIPDVAGYDLYAGTLSVSPDPFAGDLAFLTCLEGDIPQPAGAPGSPIAIPDGAALPPGGIRYYVAGHSPVAPGALAKLGLRSDGSPRPPPPVPCP